MIAPQTARYFSSNSSTSHHVIGIDLGTTNSCVAVMEGSQPKIIENEEGLRTTPSIVAFTNDGQKIVGTAAKRQAVTNPENTIYASKRLIGRRFEDASVQKDVKHLSYKVTRDKNGDAGVQARGQTYSAPQISALILSKMKQTAEAYLGKNVKHAVVTVPAYFNDQQRQATKDAGRIAGLEVDRILNEPTAAALAYGLDKENTKTIAVYDLGGGTFDISILQIAGGVFEVKATNGDTSCGGEDVDILIQKWIIEEFRIKSGTDVSRDKLAIQRVKEAAEKAKIELSSVNQTEINLPYLTAGADGPKHCELTLSKAQLETITDEFLKKTIKPCETCLRDAGLKKENIDEVILVGGMTRMPKVQQLVQKIFSKTPSKGVNPDEAVAIGAAIQGSIMLGEVKGIVLLDVTPLSLGTEIVNDIFSVIIKRNTPIPTTKSKEYTTSQDYQTSITCNVFQGEREIASENKLLGSFVLSGIPPAKGGIPKIQMTFSLDANGILQVTARDKGTGKSQSIQIQNSGGLSQDDIDRMIRQSELMKEEDRKRREAIETREEANKIIQSTQASLKEFQSKISSDLVEEIENEIKALQAAVDQNDTNKLKEGVEKVKNASMKIGQNIYSNKS